MPTFRMDQTNFVQGHRDGTRIVPLVGLRVDFNELAADSNTVGLWHLHDGGCQGEGTGLGDVSGNGHPFTNYGADPSDEGYSFVRTNVDRMVATLTNQPERPVFTVELWVRQLILPPVGQLVIPLHYYIDWSAGWLYVEFHRGANPSQTGMSVTLHKSSGSWSISWTSADLDAIIASTDPWHMAIVVSAPDHAMLFINGVLRAQKTGGVFGLPAGTHLLMLGHSDPTQAADVILDEVRLSSAARYAANFTPQRLRASGTYVSLTFDTDRTQAVWKDLVAEQGLPSGTDVTLETRAADELDEFGDPLAEWGSYDGEPSSLPLGQWFQWRATLWSSSDRLATPTVESVEAQSSDVGYNLYHAVGPGSEVLDYAQPYARAGPHICSLRTSALAPEAVHWFGIRPVDARGIESPTAQGEVRLELDWQGCRVPDRPAGVLALSAWPRPGAKARLDWRWRAGLGGVLPRAFLIFGDGGTGTLDYQVPLGEVAYRGAQNSYTWESGELIGGLEHQLAVRAVSADGAWDEQPAITRVTPDAQPPGCVDALQAEAIL